MSRFWRIAASALLAVGLMGGVATSASAEETTASRPVVITNSPVNITTESAPPAPSKTCSSSNRIERHVYGRDGDIVNPQNLLKLTTANNGVYSFVGTGLEVRTPGNSDKVTGAFDGGNTPLSDVYQMTYQTHRASGATSSPLQVPSYQLWTRDTVTGKNITLVFESIYTYGNDSIKTGGWQLWDVYNGGNGIFWTPTADVPGLPQRDGYKKFSEIVAANPNLVVLGYGFGLGSGNPGFVGKINELSFQCVKTYLDRAYSFDAGVIRSGCDLKFVHTNTEPKMSYKVLFYVNGQKVHEQVLKAGASTSIPVKKGDTVTSSMYGVFTGDNVVGGLPPQCG